MRKVIVASKNPVKIQAIKNGFAKMLSNDKFEFISVTVPSNVGEQPSTDAETLTGATNRVNNAFQEIKGADFYVGIEGGVETAGEEMTAFAWVVIKSQEKYGKAKTGTFFLPKEIIKLIKQGKELGEADDIVFAIDELKNLVS